MAEAIARPAAAVPGRVHESAGDQAFRTASLVGLAVWLCMLLFPLYWLVASSFKDPREVTANPPPFTPRPPLRLVLQLDYSTLAATTSAAALEQTMRADAVIASMIGYDRFTSQGLNSVRVESYLGDRRVGIVESDRSMTAYKVLFFPATIMTEDYLLGRDRFQKFFAEARSPQGTLPSARFDLAAGLGARSRPSLVDDERSKAVLEFMDGVRFQGTRVGVGTELWHGGMVIRFLEPLLTKTNLPPFHFYIGNSLVVTTAEILLTLLVSTMAAYALSRLISPRLSRVWILFFLVSLMIPTVATIVPGVFLAKQLGIFNSLWAVILFGVPNPFIIYILKGFMDSLPGSYFDAARIEGASELRVFWIVVIPLITASLAVAVLLIFLGSWNAFFWPFIVLNTPKKYTFPVALYYLTALVDSQNPAQQFVFGVVSSLPTLFVFAFFQKRMGKGIVWSGIKG